jgi:hypothetical protein
MFAATLTHPPSLTHSLPHYLPPSVSSLPPTLSLLTRSLTHCLTQSITHSLPPPMQRFSTRGWIACEHGHTCSSRASVGNTTHRDSVDQRHLRQPVRRTHIGRVLVPSSTTLFAPAKCSSHCFESTSVLSGVEVGIGLLLLLFFVFLFCFVFCCS